MVRGCIDRSSWHTILPCYSYCIEWKSLAYRQFKENEIEPLEGIFKNVRKRWERSLTHDWLVDNLAMLQGTRRITKILCFGLGNISKELLYNGRDEEWRLYCMTQHAVALSMADIFRSEATDVKVFVQDPAYSKADKALLKSVGITVVGECGAGGFSMIDDETVVFSCCPSVPVAQIVADVGRPAMIIGNSMISRILNNARSVLETQLPFTLCLTPRRKQGEEKEKKGRPANTSDIAFPHTRPTLNPHGLGR